MPVPQKRHWLQAPLLGQSLSFNQADPPVVQILCVGGIPWNAVVAVNDWTVKVYDSLYSACDQLYHSSPYRYTRKYRCTRTGRVNGHFNTYIYISIMQV